MNGKLAEISGLLKETKKPEDLFGVLEDLDDGGKIVIVERRFRQLIADVDSVVDGGDNAPEVEELAESIMERLQFWHDCAVSKIHNGVYSFLGGGESEEDLADPLVVKMSGQEHRFDKFFASGEIADVFSGPEGLIAKIARDPADNVLIRNEFEILQLLRNSSDPQLKHLPLPLGTFQVSGATGNREAIIFEKIDGSDLFRVINKRPGGMPPYHACWVFARLLSILGMVHSKGFIHGNIDPTHILLHGQDHNVFLIDWTTAIKPDERFKLLNNYYSSPECRNRSLPLPKSDLYSLGKCMVMLLGGDIKTNSLPPSVDYRLNNFLLSFLAEEPSLRENDAWELYERLGVLREEIFGAHDFTEFIL